MRVLGLDPSLTAFGWAVHDTAADGTGRCEAKGVIKTSSKTLFVDRYVHLREATAGLLKQHKPDKVGLESSVFHAHQSEALYALFTNVCEALKLGGADVVFLTPPQVKAHARLFLGRPQKPKWIMQKPDMVEAARTDCGGKGRWNHNEADAYWVARVAARFWQLRAGVITESDLNPEELKHFTYVHHYKRGKRAGQVERRGLIWRNGDRFHLWSGETSGTENKGSSKEG